MFVNIENGDRAIFGTENRRRASINGFASSGGDSIKVLEKPEAVIRGQ
jgi:hypothetical protein